MKKKFIIALFLFMGVAILSYAEDKQAFRTQRNEIRIGWGDQLFETLMWHNPTHIIKTMPETFRQTYKERYRYSQHIWLEYQWRFNSWLSLGAMMDISEVGWDLVTRDGKGTELSRNKNNYFYNLVLMPTVRFTYFHHPNVNLYSGIGLGIDINGGTEVDGYGRHTVVGAAVNGTVFGVSANYKQFFCAVDFGGLTALKDKNTIFMAVSRIMNASIGIRF